MSDRFRSVKTFDMSVRQPVAHRVPEVEDAVPVRAAEEAGSVHDVGLAGEDGPEEDRVFLRVVLEVGVLDDDEIAGRGAHPGPDRRALPQVARLQEDADAVLAVELAEDVAGAVRRAVVHDHDLALEVPEVHGEDLREDLANRPALVVRRHHDRQLHRSLLFQVVEDDGVSHAFDRRSPRGDRPAELAEARRRRRDRRGRPSPPGRSTSGTRRPPRGPAGRASGRREHGRLRRVVRHVAAAEVRDRRALFLSALLEPPREALEVLPPVEVRVVEPRRAVRGPTGGRVEERELVGMDAERLAELQRRPPRGERRPPRAPERARKRTRTAAARRSGYTGSMCRMPMLYDVAMPVRKR